MMFTSPARLNTRNAPSTDSWTSTLFGVGGAPATQFRLEANGRAASAGHTVRKLEAVPPTAVTFIATAVAEPGIEQLPLAPCTRSRSSPPGPTGVATSPTVSGAGRVSTSRQGGIGTRTDGCPPSCPNTLTAPPVTRVAAAAATAATARDRLMSVPPPLRSPRHASQRSADRVDVDSPPITGFSIR